MTALLERVEGAATSSDLPGIAPSNSSSDFDFGGMPFVGRSKELSRLLAAQERTRSGRTEVVMVEGEAGAGKSRLVSEFASSVAHRADVISGRAFETLGELPYGVLVEALRSRVDEENAPEDLLGDLWLAELASLLPELRERYPDLPELTDDPELRRGRLFEAVTRFCEALAERKPLVFALGDVQWTDSATRDLVRYAVRRWTESGISVLVILTVRSRNRACEPELNEWLAGLQHDTPTLRLQPGSLPVADVEQMIRYLTAGDGRSVPDRTLARFAEWLARLTDGNPLCLSQALRMLLEEGVLHVRPLADGGRAIAVPESIDEGCEERLRRMLLSGCRALIGSSLYRLGPLESDLLVAASVLNDRFTDQRLIEVAAVDEDTGLRALDVLVRERLLREHSEDDAYTFISPLIRDAVIAEAGRARRRVYQRRVLTVVGQPRKACAGIRAGCCGRLSAVPRAKSMTTDELSFTLLILRTSSDRPVPSPTDQNTLHAMDILSEGEADGRAKSRLRATAPRYPAISSKGAGRRRRGIGFQLGDA